MHRLLSLLPLVPAVLYGQGLDPTLGALAQVREFRESAISPDGSKVAFVETKWDRDRPRGLHLIYVADRPTGSVQRLTAGDGATAFSEHDVAWSPDGGRVAFLSDAVTEGQFQLYAASSGGGMPRKLTNLTGFLANPKWSPDGKQVAVLLTENARRAPGPLEAVTPLSGVVEEHIFEQRLTLVNLETGVARQISPPEMYVYEFDWAPDGQRLVYTAAPGEGDNNWYIAGLYTIDAANGATQLILKPSMQIALPRWSPDSKQIAFIGGLMSDEGSVGGDVFTIASAGGSPRNLTPGRKSSPAWIRWLPSSNRLLVTENLDGGSAISILDPRGGQIETMWRGDETIFTGSERLSVSVANDERTMALIRTSWTKAPEVWAGPVNDWRAITNANANTQPGWGKAESIHWKSDAFTVQGWLIYPKPFDSKRRYPMVVAVHGGPASLTKPNWPGTLRYDPTLLSSTGYFIFLPNPRGSLGQGEEFTRANVKDFGHGDLRDILAGCDEVVRTRPVDNNRIGITGWSYGGYMTIWAVTQTHRFRAAMAGAGLANLQSYYGQNSIDQWLIPFFGASVYDDPAVYARSSPIQFVKNVKTPTLLVVGERDGESPPAQSLEFWHALKAFGVKTQLVVYPAEGHRFHKPEDMQDVWRRAAKWFDEHLKGSGG